MLAAVLVGACAAAALAQNRQNQTLFRTHDQECRCDPAVPETLQARECSLCREAEAQPADTLFFFLKDVNPRKPNRWLILPRAHSPGMHTLRMSESESVRFWQAALERARSMWDSGWGLAVNGDRSRTQCHAHVHMGRLLDNAEGENFLFGMGGSPVPGKPVTVLRDVSQLPVPDDGSGFWIHAAGTEFHLHVEDPSAASEFVLHR